MNVVDFAVAYVAERGLAQTPVYSARRFERMMGNLPISDITEATLAEWRRKSEEAGLSVWTVKCGLKDIRTLIRANGSDIKISRIKNPEPNPNPVSLERLDAIWPHLATWSRQWLVIAFWTALRFADTVRMQRVVEPTKLEWKASKTKHRHRWPVMAWMTPHLQPVKLPYTKSEDWSEVIVRGELTRVCKLAGVDRILPSEVRDAALRAWCQADARVGEIVHGCRLGVIGHYVDPLDIIQPVANRVKVPSCFGANETNSEDLTLAISKLDPDARRMVTEMAYRLAR
jgi:hypothetical protein